MHKKKNKINKKIKQTPGQIGKKRKTKQMNGTRAIFSFKFEEELKFNRNRKKKIREIKKVLSDSFF